MERNEARAIDARFGAMGAQEVRVGCAAARLFSPGHPCILREDAAWLAQALRGDGRVHVVGEGSKVWHRSGHAVSLRWADVERALSSSSSSVMPTFLGGTRDGVAHFAMGWREELRPLLGEAKEDSLRDVLALLGPDDANVLGLACGLLAWQRNSEYCGRCGGVNETRRAGHSRECSSCGYETFPRTDPAVIMLVCDPVRKMCILGRNSKWEKGRFSALAGFVEPGESLEDAVAREVLEEVGVHVVPGSVRYHGSQPWPFPQSLMLGFFCHGSGDIVCSPNEIEEARWFSADDLRTVPKLPGKHTIARSLISSWLQMKH